MTERSIDIIVFLMCVVLYIVSKFNLVAKMVSINGVVTWFPITPKIPFRHIRYQVTTHHKFPFKLCYESEAFSGRVLKQVS